MICNTGKGEEGDKQVLFGGLIKISFDQPLLKTANRYVATGSADSASIHVYVSRRGGLLMGFHVAGGM